MTALSGGPVDSLPADAVPPADVPARAAGVELLGEQPGSGYREAPALVRRADGQVVQLTPLLYLVLAALDGRRDYAAVAATVSSDFGRVLEPQDVHTLVRGKLEPLGLVALQDGSQPPVRPANPLLALRFRYVVSDPARTRRLTGPFAVLFTPLLVVLATLAFAVVAYWVLFVRGLAAAAHEAFASPGLLLAVFAISVLSAGFHEFGHAAALRRGGGTPGAMGAGLYLVWPAFYTDVTDSYRLGRAARLRTDLGGLYFNALVALGMFGLWWLTGWDGLLLVIATQILQMIRQLPPLIRFDGYHLLADLTGIPDLFHRIKPTLQSLWPTRWQHPDARALRPWARVVVTLWVVLVVPLMLLTALITILTLPRILATAAHGLAVQGALVANRWQHGDWLGVGAKLLAVLALAIPVFGLLYMLARSMRQLARSVWRRTAGRPVKRALAGALAAVVFAGLAYAWWPNGNYRPIEPYERGVVQQALPAAFTGAGAAGLQEGREASATTLWPADGGQLPTADHPQLAIVLAPRSDPSAPTWVFPFNRPAPPGVGDNQSMAIATKDGTTDYDVAFALVWADHPTVLNRNEAYAFASCTGCTAVAVSFQVVLIVGQADVVAPQNIAAAVGYNCLRCVTAAMAVQLDVSLARQPDAGTTAQLNALWAQIQQFGQHLQGLSFSDIQARIADYEKQILRIVQVDLPKATPSVTSSGTPSASPSTSGGATPSDSSTSSSASNAAGSSTATAPTSTTSPDGDAPTTPSTSTPSASRSSAAAPTAPSQAPSTP